MNQTSNFASESGHWYGPDGSPFYTIVGANGKERPTTLRDARKLGLLPSVTTVMRCAAAPGLERFKMRQLALSLLTLPRLDGETEDAFLSRAELDAQEQGKQAAAKGEEIHGVVERFYLREPYPDDLAPWVEETAATVFEFCGEQEWRPEKSFASSIGYGGKVDLHSSDWVIDFKTKDDDRCDIYDEHAMQLAAYRDGLSIGAIRCAIVFINRNAPRAKFVEVTEDELGRGWHMFRALLDFWRSKTGYKP